MAEKKFVGVDGAVDSAEVQADYNGAEAFEKLRVGKLGAYFKDGLKTRYIPYDRMERAFIRIQEVNGRMCCGSTVFAYFRMVFVVDGKEYADVISEDEKTMDAALACIARNAPAVAIGVDK